MTELLKIIEAENKKLQENSVQSFVEDVQMKCENGNSSFQIMACDTQLPFDQIATTKSGRKNGGLGKLRSNFLKKKRPKTPYSFSSAKFFKSQTNDEGVKRPAHKTPLSLLFEMKPRLKINVNEVQGRREKYSAVINENNGVQFEGFGISKKIAKHNAAVHALQCYNPAALINIMNIWNKDGKSDKSSEDTDFASDEGWIEQVQPIGQINVFETLNLQKEARPVEQVQRKLDPETYADKNPVVLLNELEGQITTKSYQCTETKGQNGRTYFTMQLDLEGENYTGMGTSKKQARCAAAIIALQKKHKLEHSLWKSMLYTYDHVEAENKDGSAKKKPEIRQGKNPVMILNEKIPQLKYELKAECGKYDSSSFVMQVQVNGVSYEGVGKNKKQAKVGAAISALRSQFGIETNLMFDVSKKNPTQSEDNKDYGGLPDLIHKLVREKFAELTDNMQSPNAKHKVLAGVVLTRSIDPTVNTGEVIAISTGTKCVNGSSISHQGTVLMDCHAEIVCRRGLVKYLYHQLLDYKKDGDNTNSVIEPCKSGKGFQLKSDVYFHLYINTTPCGDARIFSLREDERHIDDHPNRKSRGQLRTKVEVGQGTIPVENEMLVNEKNRCNQQQMWDAIIGGERLLTMSCSDKISKWNVLGAQGALLNIFLEKMKFTSVVVGSLYHSEHIHRGLYERSKLAVHVSCKQNTTNNETNLTVTKPILLSVSNPRKRDASGKAPLSCLQWNVVDSNVSMVNASTGKLEDATPSVLCKREFLKLFLQLLDRKNIVPRIEITESANHPLTYSEWKDRSIDYQRNKNVLMKGFELAGFGSWVGKPTEVDSFYI